jgi:hypothetical protein
VEAQLIALEAVHGPEAVAEFRELVPAHA